MQSPVVLLFTKIYSCTKPKSRKKTYKKNYIKLYKLWSILDIYTETVFDSDTEHLKKTRLGKRLTQIFGWCPSVVNN